MQLLALAVASAHLVVTAGVQVLVVAVAVVLVLATQISPLVVSAIRVSMVEQVRKPTMLVLVAVVAAVLWVLLPLVPLAAMVAQAMTRLRSLVNLQIQRFALVAAVVVVHRLELAVLVAVVLAATQAQQTLVVEAEEVLRRLVPVLLAVRALCMCVVAPVTR
jgi:hypothetical protein